MVKPLFNLVLFRTKTCWTLRLDFAHNKSRTQYLLDKLICTISLNLIQYYKSIFKVILLCNQMSQKCCEPTFNFKSWEETNLIESSCTAQFSRSWFSIIPANFISLYEECEPSAGCRSHWLKCSSEHPINSFIRGCLYWKTSSHLFLPNFVPVLGKLAEELLCFHLPVFWLYVSLENVF